MFEPNQPENSIDKVEAALLEFWNNYSRQLPIKGRHTELTIKPKIFLGGEINPQVLEKIAEVYLAKVTVRHILSGQVVMFPERIQIKDETGEVVVEIENAALIKKVINQVTVVLGRHLAEKNLIASRPNQIYCFGDIQEALADFLVETEKCDSKNLLREATVLLLKTKAPV